MARTALTYLQARLKYLIAEWGMDKFRSVVEQYMGKKLQVRRWRYSLAVQGWH